MERREQGENFWKGIQKHLKKDIFKILKTHLIVHIVATDGVRVHEETAAL